VDLVCLLVAGVVRATLPGPDFTLAWEHSVEKLRWEERYRVDGGELLLVEARVQGHGAGMEPPPDAVLERGAWTWRPQRRLAELNLTYSTFAGDYRLCGREACRDLGAMTGPLPGGTAVAVRPCAPPAAAPGR